jgi:hypothetical protein
METIDTSDYDLYDSDTAEPVNAEDLGISTAEYDAAIIDSLASTEDEGHILVAGRRVFADLAA